MYDGEIDSGLAIFLVVLLVVFGLGFGVGVMWY
jgi:hypothetical protein